MKRVVQEQSSLGGLMTILCLIAIIGVGFMAYKNKERFLPTKATPKPVKAKLSEETEGKFFAARDLIISGKYDEASELLTSIDTEKVPQPTRNWITMQNGFSRLLAGKMPEAKAEFATVEQRGPFTKDLREEALANFFVETSRLAAGDAPIPADLAKKYNLESVESFALLIFGFKNLNLGQFDEANAFLQQFKEANPPGTEIWLRRFKPIGDSFADSYTAFTTATKAAKEATDHERKQQALAVVQEARTKISQPGLIAKLSVVESELKKQVDAVTSEMSKQNEAAEAADRQILNDVKTRVAGYNEKLQFADAHQIVFTATVEGDKAKVELDQYFKRTQWLSKFKDTMVKDINSAGGYLKPLTKKDSTSIATGIQSADDTQLLTPTKAPVQWNELASDSLIAMAKEYITKNPDNAPERKWLLGNFVYQLGRKTEALALLRDASGANAEYKEALAMFPETAAK